MATLTATTITPGSEDRYVPSPISIAFSALLGTLALHIEAERDIEDVDIWDPAFANWLRDAEEIQTRLSRQVLALTDAEETRDEDEPLRRMAMLIEGMTGSEEPGTFQRLHPMVVHYEHLFRCEGTTATALRVDRMLLTAAQRLETMASLDIYLPDALSPAITELFEADTVSAPKLPRG
ncbi:hypothetical protein [Frigidibacter sp. MR17.24]|uniref:hypothetical protein n=1 Tax=Frigidibacter sp. MR17.24 TaxID=3127345 RepID=UPI0030130601